MKVELVFRTPGSPDSALEGVRLFFAGHGYRQVEEVGSGLVFERGSRLQRLLSLRIEEWPTVLRVLVFDVSDVEAGVLLRYDVSTGLHLVGTLDHSVLEAEAALLEDYLLTGRRRDLTDEVAPLRRPILVATVLNMVIAIVIITWIGVMGDFPLHWVAVAAGIVAFLDGIVIMAFADLIVEGARRLPRLNTDRDDRDATPSPGMGPTHAGDARGPVPDGPMAQPDPSPGS